MGLFDSIKTFTDTIKGTYESGKAMWKYEEIADEIMEKVQAMYDNDDLNVTDTMNFQKYMEICGKLKRTKAGSDEHNDASNAKDVVVIEMFKSLLDYDSVDEELKDKINDALAMYDQAKEAVVGIFEKHCDGDEESMEKIREAVDEEFCDTKKED